MKREEALLKTAEKLVEANNRFTTLEVKLEARTSYPDFYITQKMVHDEVEKWVRNGVFKIVDDNGIYRTYAKTVNNNSNNMQAKTKVSVKSGVSLVNAPVLSPQKRAWITRRAKAGAKTSGITKKQALEILEKSRGKFVTVVFKKKSDGVLRKMNGNFLSYSNGIVTIKEAVKSKNSPTDNIRSFDLKTLRSVSGNGKMNSVI